MKKCPYCAEEIQDEAIKCRYCGEFLNGYRPPALPAREPESPKLPWYFRTWAVVVALGSVGPLALPMVWWHPKWKPAVKIGVTLVTLALTWAMYQTTVEAYKMLKDIERELQGI